MIEIINLTKVYGANGFKAIDDISFTVDKGEIFGFLGPNGAGKSTTIKCLTGILNFNDGNIRICGIDFKDNPVQAKKKIGYVPDEHIIYDGLTGLQYINFISNIFEVETAIRQERIDKYVKLFALENKINDRISTYSHGMKQKISIISALVHDPEVFVLDEPMTGLDPESSYNLKAIMAEYASNGKTVFFSSHILEVVEKLCTKVAIINRGRIISVVDLKEKNNSVSLEELFLNVTKADNKKAEEKE